MKRKWECRYSSSEMLYLELMSDHVRCYLDHSPAKADQWSFEDILAGKMDGEIANLFGPTAADELKDAVRKQIQTS